MSKFLLTVGSRFGRNNQLYLTLRGLHGPAKAKEYSETPLYPPIPTFKNKAEKGTKKAKDAVKDLNIVEEKMYQINRPKLYGWYSYVLDPDYIPADFLEFSQFSTWTTVVEGLPKYFSDKDLEEQALQILKEVGPLIEKVLVNENEFRELAFQVDNDRMKYSEGYSTGNFEPRRVDQYKSENVIAKIHEVLQAHLALTQPHLRNSAEDYGARNEGFWFRGGIKPDKIMLTKRQANKKYQEKKLKLGRIGEDQVATEEEINAAYERAIQIKHTSVVQLRHEHPLQEFVDRDDPLSTNIKVPIVDVDPRIFGIKAKAQHGTNIPGYWPEDSNQMGLLAYHTRMNRYNYDDAGEKNPALEKFERAQDIAKGIQTNFAWTLAQACHLGFSPLTELTYPLSSQSVNTDGQTWSFFAYQLNTCDLSSNDFSQHKHQNILWTQEPEQLYTKIVDGKVEGFNPAALKPLIKMMLNKPRAREYNMTPYLNAKVPRVTLFPDDYQRKRFLEVIRNQLSNRPKAVAKPEMYLWEKMLMVDHDTMPEVGLYRRRRWWHMYKYDFLGKEHWHPEFINTDEKTDRFVPKGMREPWTRKGTLNRRYNKFDPKLQIPLKDKIAVWTVPDTKYKDDGEL